MPIITSCFAMKICIERVDSLLLLAFFLCSFDLYDLSLLLIHCLFFLSFLASFLSFLIVTIFVCLSSVYAVYQLPVPCLPLVLNLSIPYTVMPASFLVVHRHNARLFFGVRPFVRLFYCSSVLASCPAAILLYKQLLSVLVLSLLLIITSESLLPILPLFAALHCVAFYLWSALTSCQKSCYLFILALSITFVLPAYFLPYIYFYCPSFSILTYYYCPVHTLVSYYKLSYCFALGP